ncbi:aminotransferase class I/II-fold pyridoxal phosphate-dependent enzyme [Rhabdothermincola sp.]|uniref:aminotransferase class I/II-fold pyridoxal phosphate-dependent enzyme n=1 Tax=Rhabdothermincola sp. TaxID=2820405 RepID=UPI002FE242F4
MTGWADWVDRECRLIEEAGQWRTLRALDGGAPETAITNTGSRVVSFASNDYLGLSQHPSVKAAAIDAIQRWGTGAGASRLIVGSRPIHDELEAQLAGWRGTQSALVFPTGYSANTGTLATLAGPGTVVCSDALNHASIIDGCRLAGRRGAEVRVYRHADPEHLRAQLASLDGRRALVVTDTVFSMDGDVAPLDAIAGVCRERDALLVVDDAHAVFDVGADLSGVEVVRVGTLSKTLGSLGGFVAASRRIVELLVNRARPFVFTTALTPADTAAALAALEILRSGEGEARRRTLREHIEVLAPGHPTPILPVVIGDEPDAVAASAALAERGLLVPAIRPPTVPPGTCRLRVALSAAHTGEQVLRLRAALDELDLAVSTP